MKKVLILITVALITLSGFSQKNISNEIFDLVNTINSVAIGKKLYIDNDILRKRIQNMPGIAEINQILKDYESNGKWLSDGITIAEELKPYINIKGETLVYFSKNNADLKTATIDLNIKAYIVKISESKELEINYYLDYSVSDPEGKQLLSVKIEE